MPQVFLVLPVLLVQQAHSIQDIIVATGATFGNALLLWFDTIQQLYSTGGATFTKGVLAGYYPNDQFQHSLPQILQVLESPLVSL